MLVMPRLSDPGPTLSRRDVCRLAAAASLTALLQPSTLTAESSDFHLVDRTDRQRILKAAEAYLPLVPQTITAYPSDRSPGGLHDYFSQADYFWPDPANPGGKYINRDGQSNPGNFDGHRKAMIALSIRMPALTAAWLLTKDRRYAECACDHLRAWFIASATRMNPNLEYSQGVVGVATGRSYGIIDTLHLVEVARAASIVAPRIMTSGDLAALKDWFRSYLTWMKTSDKGKQERDALNNHATCWALQASEYARLIGDKQTRQEIHRQYTDVLLPNQMGPDGSFPKELTRTKPYSYSIFNFDTMAGLCQSLLGTESDLFKFQLPDGRGICKGAQFLYPYLKDKSAWPYKHDVEHFDSLPVRSPGLLFTGLACHRKPYIALWKTLDPDPTDPEIIRNFPIRQPLLWIS